jgi:uncharacterized iron-regulated membrane protein
MREVGMPHLILVIVYVCVLADIEILGKISEFFGKTWFLWLCAALLAMFCVGFVASWRERPQRRETPKKVGPAVQTGIATTILYSIFISVGVLWVAFSFYGGRWLLIKVADWLKGLIF